MTNGTGATASPRFDLIGSSRIQDGGTAEVYVGPGGLINQATNPGSGPHIPQTTSYPVTVNITDPKFISLTNLTVTMNLQQAAALGEIRADLIAPDGTIVNTFPEPDRRVGHDPRPTRRSGSRAPTSVLRPADAWARSSTIARPGVLPTGERRPRSSAPSAPKGALALLDGLTAAKINGTWTLRITDFRATTLPHPLRRPTSSSTGPSTSPRDSRIVRIPRSPAPMSSGLIRDFPQGFGRGRTNRASARGSRSPRTIPWARSALTWVGCTWLMSTMSISRPTRGRHRQPGGQYRHFLAYSENGGQSWVNAGQVNDDLRGCGWLHRSSAIPQGNSSRWGGRSSCPTWRSTRRPARWSCRGVMSGTMPRAPGPPLT